MFIRKTYIIGYHYNGSLGVSKMTDIILVGCGKAGSIHCKCHTKLKDSNIKIIAMVDSNPDRLKRFHSLYKTFNDGENPLAAGSLEEVPEQLRETINKNHLILKFARTEFSEDRGCDHSR